MTSGLRTTILDTVSPILIQFFSKCTSLHIPQVPLSNFKPDVRRSEEMFHYDVDFHNDLIYVYNVGSTVANF